jgi:hypothetical protein
MAVERSESWRGEERRGEEKDERIKKGALE